MRLLIVVVSASAVIVTGVFGAWTSPSVLCWNGAKRAGKYRVGATQNDESCADVGTDGDVHAPGEAVICNPPGRLRKISVKEIS